MKKYILILFLLICYTSQAQTWDKMYNFTSDTVVASSNGAQFAEDSFFIAAGQCANFTTDSLKTYLAVFDYSFNILQKKLLFWPGKYNRLDGGNNDIAKIDNDRYVLVGIEQDLHTNSRIEVDQLYFYIFDSKLDSILGKKYFDTVVSRNPYSVMVDKQGNFLVTGSISSHTISYDSWLKTWSYDSSFIWVAKYNKNANLIWEKHFSSFLLGDPYGTKIILGHDSASYILTGIDDNLVLMLHNRL